MAIPVFDTSLIATQLASLVPDTVLEIVDVAGRVTADRARRLTQRPGILIMSVGRESVWRDGNGGDTKVNDRIGITFELTDLGRVERTEQPGLGDMQAAVHALLEGCQLSPDWAELRYEGGELQEMTDSLVVWRDVYTTWTSTSVSRWTPA